MPASACRKKIYRGGNHQLLYIERVVGGAQNGVANAAANLKAYELVSQKDVYHTCHCVVSIFFLMIRRPPRSTLFPYNDALPILTGLRCLHVLVAGGGRVVDQAHPASEELIDRKSTRLNSSHGSISYAVFCL